MSFSQVITSVSVISSCLNGHIALSLTDYESNVVSSIAAGSSCEVAGSFFKCNTDVSIDGWASITNNTTAFIILTPSGTAGSQIITASWQQNWDSIVWVASKNGYYTSAASVVRVIGGAFKISDTQQERKWVYRGKDAFILDFGYNINTIVGSNYNRVNAGSYNTGIGCDTIRSNTTGSYNTAVGYHVLYTNTTGSYNTAIGYHVLYTNTTGSYNTAIGCSALYNITIGSSNVAIGHQALFDFTNGNYNTAIGYNALNNFLTGTNNTGIGYNAQPAASDNVFNSFTLGNSNITVLRRAVTSITALSDKRDKKNIVDISLGMKFINAMKPVEFDWDKREWYIEGKRDESKESKHDFGFIAQDLQELQNNFDANWVSLVYDVNPDKLETSPGMLIPIIIKGMQEMYAEIQIIKEKINA